MLNIKPSPLEFPLVRALPIIICRGLSTLLPNFLTLQRLEMDAPTLSMASSVTSSPSRFMPAHSANGASGSGLLKSTLIHDSSTPVNRRHSGDTASSGATMERGSGTGVHVRPPSYPGGVPSGLQQVCSLVEVCVCLCIFVQVFFKNRKLLS